MARVISLSNHNATRATSAAAIETERGSVADAPRYQNEYFQACRGYVPFNGNCIAIAENVEDKIMCR